MRIGPKQIVYQNQYQQIYRVSVEFETFIKELFVNDYGRRAGLLFVKGDSILLVRQYRFLVQQLAWEIPGGKIDPNETSEEGAAREGLEETCLRCKTLKPLLYFHPGLDTFDNPTFLFYCDEFEEAPAESLHPHEVTDRVWMPLARSVEMIFKGEIVDSMTIAALLAYQVRFAKHSKSQKPNSKKIPNKKPQRVQRKSKISPV